MPKKPKVFDSKQTTLVNFGFKKQIIHCSEAINVDVPKFARPDTYNKVQCPKCPQRFKNNQGLGTHFKCLHTNDGAACSSSSDFFATSNKTTDCETKKRRLCFQ